jgi:hypothetical protein
MRYRRNTDEKIRSLERLWAAGDRDAGLALQAWKRRTEPIEVPSISSLPDLSEGIHMYAADLYCKDCGEAIRADLLQGELRRIEESGYDHQLPQVMCNNTLCDYRAPITQAVLDSDGDYQCGNDCNWPNVQIDEFSYDSDDFPKWGPGIGESDSVRHCGSHEGCLNAIQTGWGVGGEPQLIGGWLGNELTEEGVASVIETVQNNPEGFVARLWAELYSDDDDISEAAGDTDDDEDEDEDYDEEDEENWSRRRNPRPPLDLNHKIVLFAIWWLRQKRGRVYYSDVASLMQKVIEDKFELGKILRRLQDQGYIDDRPGGYFLYQPGSEIAWEMAKVSQDYGRLPDLLTRSNPTAQLNDEKEFQSKLDNINYCLHTHYPSYEDVAGHLISISLPKIIKSFINMGIIPESTTGINRGDLGLRSSLRQSREGNISSLFRYLLLARRAGLNVIEIDESAWLAALNEIMMYYFDRSLDSIILFDAPLNFVEYRNSILTKYPESDILVETLGEE